MSRGPVPVYRRLVRVADGGTGWSPEELRRLVRQQSGLDYAALAPASSGESRTTFWFTDRAGTVSVLKIMPGAGPETVSDLYALDLVAARLRDRGYPGTAIPRRRPRARAGVLGPAALPGSVVDHGRQRPDRAVLGRLLPELLRLNGTQAGLRTGPREWPALLTQTLTIGWEGYCLHSTLQARPDTRGGMWAVRGWAGVRNSCR
jgi:hypothetical protein